MLTDEEWNYFRNTLFLATHRRITDVFPVTIRQPHEVTFTQETGLRDNATDAPFFRYLAGTPVKVLDAKFFKESLIRSTAKDLAEKFVEDIRGTGANKGRELLWLADPENPPIRMRPGAKGSPAEGDLAIAFVLEMAIPGAAVKITEAVEESSRLVTP